MSTELMLSVKVHVPSLLSFKVAMWVMNAMGDG